MAKRYVPEYEAASTAPEGNVQVATEDFMRKNWRKGDFVLSRTNAPLAKWCLAALSDGYRAFIQGKDVGKSLQAVVRKSQKETIKEFLEWLMVWEKEQVELLATVKKEDKIEEIRDKVEVLVTLCEGMKTMQELLNRIENLFSDSQPDERIMFSSIHKAKGLETTRVWMFRNTFFNPMGNPKEEENLYYVAITRAKQDLFLADINKK